MKMKFWIALPVIWLMMLQCAAAVDGLEKVEQKDDNAFVFEPSYDTIRVLTKLQLEIDRLKNYSKNHKNQYSTNYAVLIDMRISSKYKRFVIVDLIKDSIVERALVAHGSGSETGVEDSLQFSNVPNSYMSSLGLYKIGADYQGNFGRSFKLHGLEKTNSKAFERFVVLHRYMCVPDDEQIDPICNSLGCPMLSENFFGVMEKYIDKERLPILMNMYY